MYAASALPAWRPALTTMSPNPSVCRLRLLSRYTRTKRRQGVSHSKHIRRSTGRGREVYELPPQSMAHERVHAGINCGHTLEGLGPDDGKFSARVRVLLGVTYLGTTVGKALHAGVLMLVTSGSFVRLHCRGVLAECMFVPRCRQSLAYLHAPDSAPRVAGSRSPGRARHSMWWRAKAPMCCRRSRTTRTTI